MNCSQITVSLNVRSLTWSEKLFPQPSSAPMLNFRQFSLDTMCTGFRLKGYTGPTHRTGYPSGQQTSKTAREWLPTWSFMNWKQESSV